VRVNSQARAFPIALPVMALFRNVPVAVIGGGDVAIEEGMFLTRFASKVYIIHRRDRLRATKILQEKAFKNERVEVLYNSVVDEIYGQNMVEGLRLRNVKTGEKADLSVNGAFVFIGYIPNLDFLGTIVKKSDDKYIIVDKEMATSREGILHVEIAARKISNRL